MECKTQILDIARERDYLTVAAIYDERDELTFPDELFPDIFRICCKQLEINELASLRTEKGVWNRASYEEMYPKKAFQLAMMAMELLGSVRMHENVQVQLDQFETVVSEHWPELFAGLKEFYRVLVGGKSANPKTPPLFSNVIVAVLRDGPTRRRLITDMELQQFIWTLWMSSGPPALEDEDDDSGLAAVAITRMHVEANQNNPTLFPACMVVCDQFGGKMLLPKSLSCRYSAP